MLSVHVQNKSNRISVERVSDAVRKHLGFRSNTFLTLTERVRCLVRTCLACRSNAFGFSFQRIWLLVRTRFERVQAGDRMRLDKKTLYFVSDGNFADAIINSFLKDGRGFRFVRYTRQFFVMLTNWEHAVCPLSGIKKRPLVGGRFTTSSTVNSIGAIASVLH